MHFEPTYESVHQHQVPQWFNDAKFGIFIHWSLFSVPAFATSKRMPSITEHTDENGEAVPMEMAMAEMPYAEWYMNKLRIQGSSTQEFHKQHFGEVSDDGYYAFQEDFEEQNKDFDVNEWAELIEAAGAKYCVLVTKHHDGYCLWPTDNKNPIRPNLYSKRDFVGELTEAIRARDLKMGLYYSGVYDWSFKTNRPIDGMRGFLEHQDMPEGYVEYSVSHFKELIDKYKPSIMWNDIAFPSGYNLNELFAYYYNNVEDGVIDDRWAQNYVPKTEEEWAEFKMEMPMGKLPEGFHYDFVTPEYAIYDEVKPYKWETTRGIGLSFGYNRYETGSDYLSGKEIIDMIIQVVSRNGNVLLNIGPRADGTVPYEQKRSLLTAGKWLKLNGEAIYATVPNDVPEVKDCCGNSVCFTKNDNAVFAIDLRTELPEKLTFKGYNIPEGKTVTLIGTGEVSYQNDGENVVLTIPADYTKELAYAFKIA